MELLLGQKVLHGGNEVATGSLHGVIGVYFSAHWCGPCRSFTPQFRKVYERAKLKGKAFEVVFVSSDHDENSFKEYFSTMPWHAVPFADRSRQQQLSSLFQVRGIPFLGLLDAKGQVLDWNARSKVMEPGFISTLPRSVDLKAVELPQPCGPVAILIRYFGKEFEIECEPSEGWEMLRMQIYSMTEVPPEQMKLFGLGLDAGLLDDSVPLGCAIARAWGAQKGTGLKSANVAADARKASSSYNDEHIGQRHHSGTMDSKSAWCSRSDDKRPWYQMDLGEVKDVAGVILAARADNPQWVTRFKISTAASEDGTWQLVDDGREFDGPTFLSLSRAVFHCSCKTRFVRVEPSSYKSHCSLRADVLLASEAGAADQLPTIVVLGNFSAGDPFEAASEVKSNANVMLQEQYLAMLQAKLSSLPPKLQNQVSALQTVQRYENRQLQCQACWYMT
ncbi:unnamed protein product [Durusdinium trenchii]|uniref:Nucleoredoxin n=2 Tax=Durusdinium trenchii TaxID=1381693 RepID=A0ABP0MRA3_9DINO